MKNRPLIFLSFLLIFLFSFPVSAQDDEGDDIKVYDFELDKLLSLGSGMLALALFIFTRIAYKRTQNKRLSYVSVAFLLFAIKGFAIAHELVFAEWPLIDVFSNILDFAILIIFFLGIIKK